MALKDSAGLVKMYAMVNVQQYQLVATAATVAECEQNYINLLAGSNLSDDLEIDIEKTDITGTVTDIRTAVVEGTTKVYLKLDDNAFYYVVSVADSEAAILLNVGDSVSLQSAMADGDLRSAYDVKKN